VGLRASPGGDLMDFLPNGSPVAMLYSREVLEGTEWILVRDVLGREGWDPSSAVMVRP
jgi:hypothetical protein